MEPWRHEKKMKEKLVSLFFTDSNSDSLDMMMEDRDSNDSRGMVHHKFQEHVFKLRKNNSQVIRGIFF
jgi:hypothetical protein